MGAADHQYQNVPTELAGVHGFRSLDSEMRAVVYGYAQGIIAGAIDAPMGLTHDLPKMVQWVMDHPSVRQQARQWFDQQKAAHDAGQAAKVFDSKPWLEHLQHDHRVERELQQLGEGQCPSCLTLSPELQGKLFPEVSGKNLS